MTTVELSGSALNSALEDLLMSDDIVPGSDISYQLCKTIYTHHPLGGKIVDKPLTIAFSQDRKITVPDGPEERLVEAFTREWKRINANANILNVARLSRIYGIASLVAGVKDKPTNKPLSVDDYVSDDLFFNAADPLNTSGSLILNQNPNASDFQKPQGDLTLAGQTYHKSRCVVLFNESPIYIDFTTSAFGFVGRSVFQRILFPMKSYVQTMITDDMVARKAGVLVAKIKTGGSVIDKTMSAVLRVKRRLLKEAKTDNVINIGTEDAVETLNLQNADTAMLTSRNNILSNIAAGAPMPAKLLTDETYAEGFGEGTEDAKDVARYIDNIRLSLAPLFDFFDQIVMYRAWNKDFYAALQNEFPEYRSIPYESAFYRWKNSFEAVWPSLLVEPESKQVEVSKVKFESMISVAGVMLAQADPENKARIMQWICDNINAEKHMFTSPLLVDAEAMANYQPPATPDMGMGQEGEEEQAPGFKPATFKPKGL